LRPTLGARKHVPLAVPSLATPLPTGHQWDFGRIYRFQIELGLAPFETTIDTKRRHRDEEELCFLCSPWV